MRIWVNTVFILSSIPDRKCEICKRTKITRAPLRRRNGGTVPRAENFGDLIRADHKVFSDNCESRNNHRYAVVKTYHRKLKEACKSFVDPDRKAQVIYTDNSLEFGKSCENLSWNHCTSTPNRSETNVISERAVRFAKEGTSAVLLQSGLNESWWGDSMEWYTYLRNVINQLSDGKTPYERRLGQPFQGPIIPFGSLVEFHPITAKDQSRIHQFGKKVFPGLFLGHALYAGGIWKGDVLVADFEELETMDASETYSKERPNANEVIFPQERGEFFFSNRRWTNLTPWMRSRLENIHFIRQRPIQGDSHIDFLGESEGSLPQPQDSFPDAGEAIFDFWSMSGSFIYRFHVEPIVKLHSPREESFLFPLKYIDVSRTTCTNLDVKQEKRIDDYWNVDGSRDLSDPWTGFTQFYSIGRNTSRMIYVVRWEINEKTADIYGQKSGKQWKRMLNRRRSKSGPTKTSILTTHENCEGSISFTRRIRNSKKPSRMLVRNWKHQWLPLCFAKF